MEKVSDIRRPIEFTIDGRSYTTTDHKQQAGELLRLAGLDPNCFDLGELKGQRPEPIRYRDDETVTIPNKSRFVSIRHRANVA